MVNQVRVQPSAPHGPNKRTGLLLSRELNVKRSVHGPEAKLAIAATFRDYYQRVSLGRVIAVCFLTPIPALVVTLAIDLIPLAPPSQGWQGNYALWFRLLISTFAISLGLITQIKEVITTQPISTIGTFKVAVATSFSYVGVTILIASSWRFPIPFGYVLLVGPYVTIFSFFTVFEIGPRLLAQSSILRQQIKSQLMIVSTQGVVAVAYPLFSAVFNQLTGIDKPLL
ncbi:hypothetical protein GQ600_12490 [Phytophthora cactorum]|nr:hypothetical protein GQ600_12490 [Phytophthora cactorum]